MHDNLILLSPNLDNIKQGNINMKIVKLPDNLSQKWSGVLGEFYNAEAYSIETMNHSSGLMTFQGDTFQVLKRDHLRNKNCWTIKSVDQHRLKKLLYSNVLLL